MTGTERRAQILDILRTRTVPVSGSDLAGEFAVSRQIIVQDVAIIRAAGFDILSTNKGYLLKQRTVATRVLLFTNHDNQMEEELTTIIDLGGYILDIFIYHKVYGKLRAELSIRSRRDIAKFLKEYESDPDGTMKTITVNDHYHTIAADSEQTLNRIGKSLTGKTPDSIKKVPNAISAS